MNLTIDSPEFRDLLYSLDATQLGGLYSDAINDVIAHIDAKLTAASPAVPITADELAALRRFYECAEDGEGYDVPAPMMARLAEIGLLNRKRGAFYETTEFAAAVLNHAAQEPAPATQQGDEGALEQFSAWKGYPLPSLNDEGRFDKDYLHREFVAFKAGLSRAATQQAEPAAAQQDQASGATDIRNAAFEAAASLCDRFAARDMHPAECAGAIRMMKDAINKLDVSPAATEASGATVPDAVRDVLAERHRQVDQEGWTPELDDDYADGQLSMAAACYAAQGDSPNFGAPEDWPWNPNWWKPTTDRRNLVKAGALILADIERIDRAAIAAAPAAPEQTEKP